MKTNRIVIIQCRLSSSRLPNKALKDLGGKPLLAWTMESMKKVPADRYFVATDYDSYPIIKKICDKYDYECFEGELNNVLKRFCDLLQKVKCETVIRVTADNPFLFYEAAISSVEEFENRNQNKNHCDYLTFTGLPHGSGVEIFSKTSILKAAELTDDEYDKEHVGPALYNHKENFVCEFIPSAARFNFPELRTTVDTFSDYLRAINIVKFLHEKESPFTTEQIIEACKSKEVNSPMIFVPSVKQGHGTGHLRRCLAAAIDSKGFVFIPHDATLQEIPSLLEEYKTYGLEEFQIIHEIPDSSYPPVIITDSFVISEDELNSYSHAKSLIMMDEGSDLTKKADYLLDIIPSVKSNRISNLTDSGFIIKPLNVKKEKITTFARILVCVGGEDPKSLAIPSSNILSKIYPDALITTIVSESVYDEIININTNQNITYLKKIENLREKLFEYDLVVTHYGLTAFEAIYAGCATLLLSTTKLHEQLAQKYDFAFIPENKLDLETVKKVIQTKNLYPALNLNSDNRSLGNFLQEISLGTKYDCPVCSKDCNSSDENYIVARNSTRTYRRCKNCSMIYISWSCVQEKKYEKSYFFEEYKNQYGKTYQEDFESIKKQCLKRVQNIIEIKRKNLGKNVLDIGCAYGPFLSAADDYNFTPFGTDISSDAIDYVKTKLHFPSVCSAFPQINCAQEFGITQFDVVTMWYVIEHFQDLKSVLTKVNELLKKDGIFAFSTPSAEGVSAKSYKENFFENSPSDHFSVWEPSKANVILKKFGFQVEKIVSTGHHPERFPSIKKSNCSSSSLQWKIVEKLSKVKQLGDTVEIYCRKIRDL